MEIILVSSVGENSLSSTPPPFISTAKWLIVFLAASCQFRPHATRAHTAHIVCSAAAALLFRFLLCPKTIVLPLFATAEPKCGSKCYQPQQIAVECAALFYIVCARIVARAHGRPIRIIFSQFHMISRSGCGCFFTSA